MRLEQKRRVVEVLLCGATICQPPVQVIAEQLGDAAYAAWADIAIGDSDYPAYEHDACEAAYRLIESSPTLHREFFGSTAHLPIGATA